MLFTLIYIFIGSISFSMDRSPITRNDVTYNKSNNWSGRFIGLDASKSFILDRPFIPRKMMDMRSEYRVIIDLLTLQENLEKDIEDKQNILGFGYFNDYILPIYSVDLGLVLRDNWILKDNFMFSMEYRWKSVIATVRNISNFLRFALFDSVSGSSFVQDLLGSIFDSTNTKHILSWFFYPIFILINAIPEFKFKFPILLDDKIRFVPGFFVSNVINLGINFAYEFMLSKDAFLNVEVGAIAFNGFMVLVGIDEDSSLGLSFLFSSLYFLVGFNFRI